MGVILPEDTRHGLVAIPPFDYYCHQVVVSIFEPVPMLSDLSNYKFSFLSVQLKHAVKL